MTAPNQLLLTKMHNRCTCCLQVKSASRYSVIVSAQVRHQALGLHTHGDSGSPRAIVHQGQLPKGALVMVLKQQLLLISLRLRDLEVAALYDIKVITFLSFPEHGQQLLDCIHFYVAQVSCKSSDVQQSAWLLANAREKPVMAFCLHSHILARAAGTHHALEAGSLL